MTSLPISTTKAHSLGLLTEVHDTADESVVETLQRLRPLLTAEDADLGTPPRDTLRPAARDPFPDEDWTMHPPINPSLP